MITYVDNNATTRVDPRVVEALLPTLSEHYANPSSVHQFGSRAGALVEAARAQVAGLVNCRESEVIFTSGGTEADLTALRGVLAARPSRKHVVISSVEHHAILEPSELLEREGYEVTRVRVDQQGRLDLDHLRESLRDDTALVSVMLANNETGVIMALAEVAAIARERGVPVHTDAVNAAGKIAIDIEALGVQLMSLSAHKLYGPKGAGALIVRRGTPFRPFLVGGPQERGRRGGTSNVPGIVGFGAACALCRDAAAAEVDGIRTLRDDFERRLCEVLPQTLIVGAEAPRLQNTTCACFPGVHSEALVLLLSEQGVCVSSGSACSSGSMEPSHILQAMRIDPYLAQGQIRFSFGRFNTPADVERVLEVLPRAVEKVAAAGV